jgi:hypothetical protein
MEYQPFGQNETDDLKKNKSHLKDFGILLIDRSETFTVA